MDTGYEKEVLADKIVIFRFKSTSRETVDTWFGDVVSEFAKALEEGRRTRVMYDLRVVGMLTPYTLQRAQALERGVPVPDDWRVATLVPSEFVANLVNYVISISQMSGMQSKSRVFSNEDEALAWLRE